MLGSVTASCGFGDSHALSGEKESETVPGGRSGQVLGYLFMLFALGLAGRGFPDQLRSIGIH
jgi:hypothetical protein